MDSSDLDPDDLLDGLLAVVQFLDPPYRELVYGGDWFWYEDDRWYTSETTRNGWVEKPTPDAIRGREVSDVRWGQIERQIMEDRSWP